MVLVLFLAGCGEAETEPTSTTYQTRPPAAAATPTPVPARGGTLRVPMPENPKTLHPLFLAENGMLSLYSMIFEPLVALDETQQPAAGVADSWSFSESGSLLLQIRRGIRWHAEGGELSADDVVFTINTILGNAESIYNARLKLYAQEAFLNAAGQVEIPTQNGYQLLYALQIPVIPKAYYEGKAAQTTELPRGSGPYYAESAAERGMQLAANTQWWKKQPFLEKVQAIAYKDNAAAIAAFMKNELDCVPTDSLTTDVYTTYTGVKSLEYTSSFYDFLAPNLSRAGLADVRVRRALSYAIDRKTLASNVYLGHAITAEMPVLPNSALNDLSVTRYDYSLREAHKELEAAGYQKDGEGYYQKDGKRLTFTLIAVDRSDKPLRRDTARELGRQLALAGIAIEVVPLREEDFASRLQSKDFDLALTGVKASPVPDYHYIYGANGSANVAGTQNEEAARLMGEMKGALTLEDFTALHSAFFNHVSGQVLQIGLFFRMNTLLYREPLIPGGVLRNGWEYAGIDKWFFAPQTQNS